MMHILVFIDWYEPAFRAGGPVRSMVNLIARLKDRYRFSVATSAYEYGSSEPMQGVVSDQWVSGKQNERIFYGTKGGLHSAIRHIRNENPDLVYLQGIFSLHYSLLPLLAAQICRKQVVLAPRGMLHPTALQFKGARKRLFLKAAWMLGLFRKVRFQAVDDFEADYIKAVFPRALIFRATNMAALPQSLPPLEREAETVLKLVSVARISPEKNNLFVLQLLQQLTFPVNIVFYGAPGNDERYVASFREAMNKLPEHVHAHWEGFLDPEQLQPELKKAHWFIMPTLGENFGHAIFEALAAGLPVLIGNNTPWKNLAALQAGMDLEVSQTEAWLDALKNAYRMNSDQYRNMSHAAMNLAKAQAYSDSAFAQYEKLFGV
ncbi:MAG: glycosyltransferase [Bacteroidetes bacterium]|nr:glycosyltransferase [Bacteroidota bacterium]